MADPNDKVPGQASGRFYVDSQCIDCDLCRETAPANFQRSDEQGFSYVYKQPETAEEEMLCKDALDNCPVEAIGSDGLALAVHRLPFTDSGQRSTANGERQCVFLSTLT